MLLLSSPSWMVIHWDSLLTAFEILLFSFSRFATTGILILGPLSVPAFCFCFGLSCSHGCRIGVFCFFIFLQPKQMSQILDLQTSNAITFTELSSSEFLRYLFKYVPPSVYFHLKFLLLSYVFELSSQESSITLFFLFYFRKSYWLHIDFFSFL